MACKLKRCNRFFPNGDPRDPRCPNDAKSCKFAHPTDPEWNRLQPTYPPKWLDQPSSSPHDKDFPMHRDHRHKSRRSRSPARRPLSPPQSRHDHSRHSHDTDKKRFETKPDSRRSSLSTIASDAPTRVNFATSSSRLPPPPPPPPSVPVPPPPPPIIPPSFAAGLSINTQELTKEEKSEAWTLRVTLMTNAVRYHAELAKLNSEETSLHQTISTRYFDELPDSERNSHSNRLNAIAERRVKVDQLLKTEINQLVLTDTWPITRSMQQITGDPTNELLSYVQELKGTASEIQKLLSNISAAKGTQTSNDNTLLEGPPLKRRRISDAGDSLAHSSTSASTPAPALPSSISFTDFDSLSERLNIIEERLGTLENSFNALDDDIDAEIDSRLESKVEELWSQKPDDEFIARMQLASDKADSALTDLKEFKEEHLPDLQASSASIEQSTLSLVESLKALSMAPDEPSARITELESTARSALQQLDVVQAAVQAHISQPAPSQPSPPSATSITPEALLSAFEGPFQESIRRKVLPLLEEWRKTIDGDLQARNKEVSSSFNTKFRLLHQVLETLQAKLSPQPP